MRVTIKSDGLGGATLEEPSGAWHIWCMGWVAGARSTCQPVSREALWSIRWSFTALGQIGITLEPTPTWGGRAAGEVYLLLAGGEEALGDLLLRGEAPLEKRIP